MTTRLNHFLLFLLLLSIPAAVSAQADSYCIWGDCSNGQGVKVLKSSEYYIGGFSKGKMQGKGMIAIFKKEHIGRNMGDTDTAFLRHLNLTGLYGAVSSKEEGYLGLKKNNAKYLKRIRSNTRVITPEEVLPFQPTAYYLGNFEKGKLEGAGIYFAKNGLLSDKIFQDVFKAFLRFPLIPQNAAGVSGTYQGNFSDGNITWEGKVEITTNNLQLAFDVQGRHKMNDKEPYRYTVKNKPGNTTGFIEEVGQGEGRSGWIKTNISNLPGLISNSAAAIVTTSCPVRMLFYENDVLGQMPCDEQEAGAARAQVSNQEIQSGRFKLPYTGQVNEAGLPDGFGSLRYANHITYTGYFINGQREGLGEYINRDPATGFLNSLFAGYFSADNFIQGISDIVGGVNSTYREYTWRDVENVYVPEQAAWIGKGVARQYVMSWSKLKSEWEIINRWVYEGGFKNNVFHGVGNLTDQTNGKKEQGIFKEGKLTQGMRKYNAGGLMYGWVVNVNGRKVCVVSQREYDPIVTFSDGTKMAKSAGEFEVLSYDNSEFKCKCSDCHSGIVTETSYDPGKKIEQWRTKYTPMYPGSAFERVETTKTIITIGERTQVYKSSCTKCWGTGRVVCKSWLPLGNGGYR